MDSRLLTPRDVGWIRRALANTLTRHGNPASPARTALRARQMAVAERPAYVTIAQIVADRLDEFPADGGIPSVETVTADIGDGDTARVQVPPQLRVKVARALEAPIDELVSRGIIGSGEVLASVLPQVTSRILAAGGRFDDSGRIQAAGGGRRFLGWSVGPHWALDISAGQ